MPKKPGKSKNVLFSSVLDRVRGELGKTRAKELDEIIHQFGGKVTKEDARATIIKDKGQLFPSLYKLLSGMDALKTFKQAQRARLGAVTRSMQTTFANSKERYCPFESVKLEVSDGGAWHIMRAHEVAKDDDLRAQVAKRFQYMQVNGEAGLAHWCEFVALLTGKTYTPDPLEEA